MSTDTIVSPALMKPGNGRWFTGFLAIACMGLGAEVLLLTRKNHELNELLANAVNERTLADVQAGDLLEPFALLGEEGERVDLQFGPAQPKSLLLVFATGCPDCERVLPIWNGLVPRQDTGRLRVLGIRLNRQIDAGSEASPAVNFPVYTVRSRDKTRIGRVVSVPTTILLDEDGVVEQAWAGVLDGNQADALRNAIAVLTWSVEPTRVTQP
jgi:hypothetical protein